MVVENSTATMMATSSTQNSSASLKRVTIFTVAFSMNDRHGRWRLGFQAVQVHGIEEVRHLAVPGQAVLDGPARLVFQRQQQALVEHDAKLITVPGRLQARRLTGRRRAEQGARGVGLVAAKARAGKQRAQYLAHRRRVAAHKVAP